MNGRMLTTAGVAAGLMVALAAGCGGSDTSDEGSASTSEPIKTITIDETEFKLTPSTVTVSETGTYEFEAVNKGSTEHALEIEGNGVEVETDTISPGESATVQVDLSEDGTYEIYCPVGDHKDRGMEGSIVVGSGGSSGGTTTDEDTDEDDSGSGYG